MPAPNSSTPWTPGWRSPAEAGDDLGVLHRIEKDGLGRAYIAGISRALDEGADVVIQMDADLSHPVDRVPVLVEKLLSTDAGVVLGSRYVEGGRTASEWPWHRKALSAWANFYVNAILGACASWRRRSCSRNAPRAPPR